MQRDQTYLRVPMLRSYGVLLFFPFFSRSRGNAGNGGVNGITKPPTWINVSTV